MSNTEIVLWIMGLLIFSFTNVGVWTLAMKLDKIIEIIKDND
jgi:hypothetical protein